MERLIGIVGGVGPYAGWDLARKVSEQTLASADQDHLPVAVLSLPRRIADRTEYLLGQTPDNPAGAITEVILRLEGLGATVVGIPCNTAHSPRIFDEIHSRLRAAGSAVRVPHMIAEVAGFVRENLPNVRRLGVLSTTGTLRAEVYPQVLAAHGLEVVAPDEQVQAELVHPAIYDRHFGIKARCNPVTETARERLIQAIEHLRARGAEAVVLGCTELPLAITENRLGPTTLIDPNLVLARALIREFDATKLKPLAL